MTRPVPEAAVRLIKEFEQLRLRAYQDVAGVWTIGWGHTRGVARGHVCTDSQAEAFLQADLAVAARALRAKIGAVADAGDPLQGHLTEGQYGALISFVFNLGTGDPRKPEWTIWGLLRRRRFDQVPAEIIRFVNADGRKLQGLVRRRAAEVVLWSWEEPGSERGAPSSGATRTIATPPTLSDPTPPQRSARVITAAVGAVAAVPVAAQQVTAAVTPYAAQNEMVAKFVSLLALIAAGAVVLGLALTWLQKRRAAS